MNILRTDDLDTRREILRLLNAPIFMVFGEKRRGLIYAAFLADCCDEIKRQAGGVMMTRPDLRRTKGEPTEVYWDLALMFCQHGLCPKWTTIALTDLVKRLERDPSYGRHLVGTRGRGELVRRCTLPVLPTWTPPVEGSLLLLPTG